MRTGEQMLAEVVLSAVIHKPGALPELATCDQPRR
jgi:hypothetical protein